MNKLLGFAICAVLPFASVMADEADTARKGKDATSVDILVPGMT